MLMIVPFVFRTSRDMLRSTYPCVLIAGVCVTLFIFCGCRRPSTVETQEAKSALTVELVSPHTALWPVEVSAGGRVAAWQESVVSSEVNGYKLDEVFVNVGDSVKKGQIIARFNDESARAKLDEMKADVETREAMLAASEDLAARSRQLVILRAVSEESHRQNETAVARGQAELSSARARLVVQKLELHHTNVVAPDDGVISSRTATAGTVLTSGSELFRLIRQNRLEWRAEVSVDYLSDVFPGQAASVEVSPGVLIHGIVRQLAPSVDDRTLNAICYVDFLEAGPAKAGMFLSGTIRIGESPALHVPESSIVYRDGYTYLIRVGEDLLAHQIKVTTGRRGGNLVEVNGDISREDRLVLSGGSFIHEGDLVKVMGKVRDGNTGGGQ